MYKLHIDKKDIENNKLKDEVNYYKRKYKLHMDKKDLEIADLKKEVNYYQRKYFECSEHIANWHAREYDRNYDDEVATENMNDRINSYKAVYEDE